MAEEQNRTWNDRYMLRLPDGMRDRIKAAAEANNRSMNSEIVATLEEKYPAPPDADMLEKARVAVAHLEQSNDPQAHAAAELLRLLIENQGKRTAAVAMAAYRATMKKDGG